MKCCFYKYLPILFLLALINQLPAQSITPYIGLHGGINFTQTTIIQPFTVITYINGEEPSETHYDPFFMNLGHQLGFSFFLRLNDHFDVGLLPEISQHSFGYSNSNTFYNTTGEEVSQTEIVSRQRLNYITIPVIARYTLMKATISPYFFGGFSYGFLRSAQHNVVAITRLQVNGEELEFQNPATDNYSSEFIHSKLNVLGGAGLAYNLDMMSISLDVAYALGLNNIAHEANRFGNQNISGTTYDVPSDLKLHHLIVNLGVVFPINKPVNKGSLDCISFKNKRRRK